MHAFWSPEGRIIVLGVPCVDGEIKTGDESTTAFVIVCSPFGNDNSCSVFTPGIDRIVVDYFGLNTVSLLANTPPFAHRTNNLF